MVGAQVFYPQQSGILVLDLQEQLPTTISPSRCNLLLPGQRDNCKWILQVRNDLRDIPGETTEVRIGIPEVQADGYLSGRIEVGEHVKLMLLYSPTRRIKSVILTADYSDWNSQLV